MKENLTAVCVRNAAHGQKLLHAMRREGIDLARPLLLVCVLSVAQAEDAARYASELEKLARSVNAELALLFSDNAVVAAAMHLRQRKVTQVFVGMPCGKCGFAAGVRRLLPRVRVNVLSDAPLYYCLCRTRPVPIGGSV